MLQLCGDRQVWRQGPFAIVGMLTTEIEKPPARHIGQMFGVCASAQLILPIVVFDGGRSLFPPLRAPDIVPGRK